MAYEWLRMRITEENDRRQKEAAMLARLPNAFQELYGELVGCLEAYAEVYGPESVEMRLDQAKIRVVVREEHTGQWEPVAHVEVSADPLVPGFRIEPGSSEAFNVEVGILPGGKLSYRLDDKYITIAELTRRVLDRALFRKLPE